jgi:putative ABC transport system permease protein
MADLALAWTIARRELRGAFRPLIVLFLCLAVGVATIAAVGVSAESVRESVRRDARALLGGDLELESPNVPVAPAELGRLFGTAARVSTTVRTATLVTAPDGRRLAVALKGVDEAWPLVGSVVLDPPVPIRDALAEDGAVVEPSLLARLGVGIGDRLRLGETSVRINAVLVREPDRLGGFAGFGPRLLVSADTVEKAGLIRPGALLRYEHRAVVPPRELEPLVQRLRALEPEAGWRLRTAAAVEPSVARFTDRLASYLTLAGLASLVVGGLGVGLAVSSYLANRRTTIAILKALGARAAEVDLAYALLVGIVAASGIGLGLIAGQLLPFLLAATLAGILPVSVEAGFHLGPLLLAALTGALTAALFAGWPLATAREVSAASLLRAEVAPVRRIPRGGRLAALGLVAAALVGSVVASVDRPFLGLVFVAGTVVTMAFLAGVGRLLLALAVQAFSSARLAVRLAARNLSRRTSGALPVLVGLGAGLGALVTIGLVETNIGRALTVQLTQRAPSHVVIDIQPDQWEPFQRIVSDTPGAVLLQSAPTLRARVTRIKGEPVDRAQVAEHVRWTIDRDRGLTWQAAPPPGTELLAGSWWPEDYAGPPLVSIEGEVARGYGVGVGDTLAFNVLGRTIEARIANVRREVDWSAGRLDFVFVLSPGVIDKAPHVRIAALHVPNIAAPRFLDRLARELPNATPIEIGSILRDVSATLEKIGLAIQVVAGITIVTGSLVLAAALTAARRRHLQQTVLFKIVGATRSQILRVLMVEHLLLASIAGVAGILAGGLAAWAVVRFAIGLEWSLDLAPPAFVLVLVTALTLAVAAFGTLRLLGSSAAAALRTA